MSTQYPKISSETLFKLSMNSSETLFKMILIYVKIFRLIYSLQTYILIVKMLNLLTSKIYWYKFQYICIMTN